MQEINFIERNLKNEETCKELIRKAESFFRKKGVNIQQDREDLTMEVLLIMLQRGDDFRGNTFEELSAFFFKTCYYVFLNHLRRLPKERKNLNNTDTSDNPGNIPFQSDNGPEEILIHEEEVEMLYIAINQLKKPSKSAIKLKLKENSYEEISEVLGLTINNVGTIISRDKENLKKILEPKVKNGYR